MTFCRSDKFKSMYKCVEAFELIRSKKGCQSIFQKRDLRERNNCKNIQYPSGFRGSGSVISLMSAFGYAFQCSFTAFFYHFDLCGRTSLSGGLLYRTLHLCAAADFFIGIDRTVGRSVLGCLLKIVRASDVYKCPA